MKKQEVYQSSYVYEAKNGQVLKDLMKEEFDDGKRHLVRTRNFLDGQHPSHKSIPSHYHPPATHSEYIKPQLPLTSRYYPHHVFFDKRDLQQ